MARRRLANGALLADPEKHRPELVIEWRCAECGTLCGTSDLNTSSALRDHVHKGDEIPAEKIAAVRAYFAASGRGRYENCACGGRTHFAPSAKVDDVHGLEARAVSLPIVDQARIVDGELVLFGRFLDGATTKIHRGDDEKGPLAPHEPTMRKIGEQARAIVDVSAHEDHVGKEIATATIHAHAIELAKEHRPHPGQTIVVSLTNANGTVSVSVQIDKEAS